MLDALLGDLEPDGTLARHDVRVVERRHEHGLSLLRDPRGDLLAALAVTIVFDDLGAECASVVELGARRIARHDDRCRHAEQPGGGRDSLRVVAGGVRDDAAPALRRVELRQAVIGAAELERSGVLKRFHLEQDPAAGDRIERRAGEERSAPRVTRKPALRRLDVCDRRDAAHRGRR